MNAAAVIALVCLAGWMGAVWAARSRIAELQARLDRARAEADRAEALLGQAMVRENGLNAANAALRRALDEAEAAAPGCGPLTVTVVATHTGLKPLDLVTGEKVLN